MAEGYTTISLKKEFLDKPEIQEYMDKMGIDNTSALCRHSIRSTILTEKGATKEILEKVIEKSDLSQKDYAEIIQEISQD